MLYQQAPHGYQMAAAVQCCLPVTLYLCVPVGWWAADRGPRAQQLAGHAGAGKAAQEEPEQLAVIVGCWPVDNKFLRPLSCAPACCTLGVIGCCTESM
jgi:hypothetical protein